MSQVSLSQKTQKLIWGGLAGAIIFFSASWLDAAPATKEAPRAAKTSSIVQGGGGKRHNNDAPIFIKSNQLSFDAKARHFVYKGAVEFKQDDLTITCEQMSGSYDENSKLQTVICERQVVISRGETQRAKANKAVYDVAAGKIELTEAPEVVQGENTLAADKVIVFVNEDRSEALGDVRVKIAKTEEPVAPTAEQKNPAASSSSAVAPASASSN